MRRFLLAPAALLAAAPAWADVTVQGAWTRATVPSQRTSGAYMLLTASADATLVGAHSPVAGLVEIHEMALDEASMTMRMRAVSAIPLPAGEPVALKPGGYHLMLMELKETLRPGQRVPLTLVVRSRRGELDDFTIELVVRPLGTRLQ